MNITREVIADLWPLYASGDLSADSRALVDEFLQQNPDYERLLREQSDESWLKPEKPMVAPDREVQSLNQTKRILQSQNWLLFFAILWSSFAFGRIVSDTSWDVSPRNFIITASIAGIFWIGFFARLVWVQRKFYQKNPKRRG
jgi:hypothetical protein